MTPFLELDFKTQHLPRLRWQYAYFLQPVLLLGVAVFVYLMPYGELKTALIPGVLVLQMLSAYAVSGFRWRVFKALVEAQTIGIVLTPFLWFFSIPLSIGYAAWRLNQLDEHWAWAFFPYLILALVFPIL